MSADTRLRTRRLAEMAMDEGPKAIETLYAGYRFRSRLEARWAVFMDALGVKYEYEKEGFELPPTPDRHGGVSDVPILRYLPDFWLPELGVYLEVKGATPTDEEEEKAMRLAWRSWRPVVIVSGECWLPEMGDADRSIAFLPTRTRGLDFDGSEILGKRLDAWNAFWWCTCLWCGAAGLAYMGRSRELPCGCERRENPYGASDPIGRIHSPELADAFVAARQARFERGETPRGRER